MALNFITLFPSARVGQNFDNFFVQIFGRHLWAVRVAFPFTGMAKMHGDSTSY
jgi:hypothetical protein